MLSLRLSVKSAAPLGQGSRPVQDGANGRGPWKADPSSPSSWRKGGGTIPPNSPSPFSTPHSPDNRRKEENESRQLPWTCGSQETRSPCDQGGCRRSTRCKGGNVFFYIFNRSSLKSFKTTPIKKKKEKMEASSLV